MYRPVVAKDTGVKHATFFHNEKLRKPFFSASFLPLVSVFYPLDWEKTQKRENSEGKFSVHILHDPYRTFSGVRSWNPIYIT
jgi:hypothetical protein